ncbi:MAG TPA: lysylphosphatidylglycerol synthase domain-containing protein [Kofleriaceae bacterium]
MKRVWKQLWPWLLGATIVVVIATRVPLAAFRVAIHEGPHLRLFVVDMAVVVTLLFTDSFATWVALRVNRVRWSASRTLVVRGATYILSLLNYAVGQGGIGYYLHRDGMSTLRATGVTLFTMGTTLATLLVVTTATWALGGHATGGGAATMWWTLVGGCIAFAIYLAAVTARPASLARRDVLAPLFDAGLGGHAAAMLARVPHVVLIVLGHWFAMLAWNIPVPFAAAVTVLPVVVVAGVLPISPAGLGTTQAALVYFFSAYASGATDDDRAASVLAFSIVHFVYAIVGQAAVGLICAPLARQSTSSSAS